MTTSEEVKNLVESLENEIYELEKANDGLVEENEKLQAKIDELEKEDEEIIN